MRIGSIGGVGVKMDSSVACVVEHGGYSAVLKETKSVSRDGIKRIALSLGGFGGTGGVVEVNVSTCVGGGRLAQLNEVMLGIL